MIKNYLLVAFRNIAKHKAFSFINVFGLAVGMAACLLILQYVVFELSYDKFHVKKDRIFRVTQDRFNKGKLSTQWAGGVILLPATPLKRSSRRWKDFVKIVGNGQILAVYKDQRMVLPKVHFAGPSFFNIFSYPLIYGDPKTAFKEPFTPENTETNSKKLFGNINPVGLTFIFDKRPMKVTGVVKDFPENTHFKSDLLMSYSTLMKFAGPNSNLDNNWQADGCLTYLLLRPGANPKVLEAKFVPFVNKIFEQYKSTGDGAKYYLQPLLSIHLYSHLMLEAEPNADGKSVYLLAGIAIFVIIIAWINYINLATARGVSRAKEVGVRNTLGSAKWQLISQFMLEAMLLNGLAVLIAVAIIGVCLPLFSSLSGQYLNLTLLVNPLFWLAVTGIFLLGTFFSGFYPAIILSNFKPVEVMKGKLSRFAARHSLLRKVMVTFSVWGIDIFADRLVHRIQADTIYAEAETGC